MVAEHFLLELCARNLETKAFDDIYARPGVGLLQNLVEKILPTARGKLQLRPRIVRTAPAGLADVSRRQPGRMSDRTCDDTLCPFLLPGFRSI